MFGKPDLGKEVDLGNGRELKVQPKFGQNEARYVCEKLSLNLMKCGNYLVVMPSEFDTVILGEPYLASMLLIDLDSGLYFGRIWNQTLAKGKALHLRDFIEVCVAFFVLNNKPCIGYPIKDEGDLSRHEFVLSQTPVPRMMSKSCHKVVHKKVSSCYECLSLRYQEKSTNTNTDFELLDESPSDNEADKVACVEPSAGEYKTGSWIPKYSAMEAIILNWRETII